MSEEIIYFEEVGDWVEEFEKTTNIKTISHEVTKPNEANYETYTQKNRYTMLGLDAADTETVIAVFFGGLFLIVFESILIGYMLWNFNQ